jgi:thiamine transport system ATP-binding protein
MLIARDLTVRIDDWIGRYDLAVPRGALMALVGPSGGGKSTLLHAIAGFERPEAGELTFDGIDLLVLPPARRPVAIVFQDHNLLPGLTAAENAGLALNPGLRLAAAEQTRVSGALERVGLAGFGGRLPAELSGGQRQRVALARALLTTRPILLLDEPLTGLNPELRRDMMALIGELRGDRRLTVVMTTHTPDDVEGEADSIATIIDGRIVAREERRCGGAPP